MLVGLANLIVGLLFLLIFGPPTFLNRELLHRSRRITPEQPEPPLRWIQVNAIVASWTGAMVAFVLLALHALGGNGVVLGWLAVLAGIYVLVVMGFNPRLIGGIVLVLTRPGSRSARRPDPQGGRTESSPCEMVPLADLRHGHGLSIPSRRQCSAARQPSW